MLMIVAEVVLGRLFLHALHASLCWLIWEVPPKAAQMKLECEERAYKKETHV